MRLVAFRSRLGAAAVLAAVAFVGGSAMAPAAFASPAATAHAKPAAVAPAPTHSARVTPDASPQACVNVLDEYKVYNTPRAVICIVTGTQAVFNSNAAFANCGTAMIASGLNFTLSSMACAQAAYG
ncbi:hypothetical protein [Kitasatospora kifunensis]|uniref:Uncharacterized protein n=1 Tax=Kitasatospora kifunensis TaxID=58351 RepID=A0A7W7VZ26_KITKI|nr:hypothetical protein [Kitasatospora kifunensis]MBB4928126.1 hypothetical protein [Kitasatospora kifunensis]